MDRNVIPPSLPPRDSPRETLQVLQRRLQSAEDETQGLVDQLAEYGFHKENYRSSESQRAGYIEPILPFRAGNSTNEAMRKEFEHIVGRVCRAESTIQSLKLGLVSLQAEKALGTSQEETEKFALAREAYEREVKKLSRELTRCKQALSSCEEDRQRADVSIQRLTEALEAVATENTGVTTQIDELRQGKHKLHKKVLELQETFAQEHNIRASLEKSHNTLLERVHDMETMMKQQKKQTQSLTSECQKLQVEVTAATEEYQKEYEMRTQLENLLSQIQSDAVTADSKLAEFIEERKDLVQELLRYKSENVELREQFESLRQAHENLKSNFVEGNDELEKTKEALKITATDNRALLNQHKESVERERNLFHNKLVEKEQLYENIRNSFLEDLDKERKCLKEKEEENCQLKDKLKQAQIKATEQKKNLEKNMEKLQAEVTELHKNLTGKGKEIGTLIQDKNQLLTEINEAVQTLEVEKGHLENQLRDACEEINDKEHEKMTLEQENQRVAERLIALEQQQNAQQQVEEALREMLEDKNRLAYEKGTLQSRVDQNEAELRGMSSIKLELEQQRKHTATLQAQHNKALNEVKKHKDNIKKLEFELKKKQTEAQGLQAGGKHAEKQLDQLVKHTEQLEKNYLQKIKVLECALNDCKDDNKRMASTLEGVVTSHSQLQNSLEEMSTEMGMKDNQLSMLKNDRSVAQKNMKILQKELNSLQHKLVAMETSEVSEVEPMRQALQIAKRDNNKLAQTLEKVMASYEELQGTHEKLHQDLERKDAQVQNLLQELEKNEIKIQKVLIERDEEVMEYHAESSEYDKKLAEIKNKHKRDVAKLKHELESAQSLKKQSVELRKKLEEQNTELEEKLTKAKDKISSLKSELNITQKSQKNKEKEEKAAKDKIKIISQELSELEKTKRDYISRNREQTNTIKDFMSKISELEEELKALVVAQQNTQNSLQETQEQLEHEKSVRKGLEQRYNRLQAKEKDIDKLRKETEKKLEEANVESVQVAENLNEAHEWFKNKFDSLQAELSKSKKVQSRLEKDNLAQRKKVDQEKRRAEAASLQAQGALRQSRLTLNKVTSDLAENHWETQGMKHALETQTDTSLMASLKLQKLQEASARQTEELAQELEFFKSLR